MLLLIDGYNLLHATPLFGSGELAGTLQGSREALLQFLAARLTASQRRQAEIVFDAADAPPGLLSTLKYEGITIHFARDYPDADSMLEAILDARSSCKNLLVVSSDHRVQRAARRNGAKWTDAEPWYRELSHRHVQQGGNEGQKPPIDSLGDSAYWTNEFSDAATLQSLEEEQSNSLPASSSMASESEPTSDLEGEPTSRPPRPPSAETNSNPFPEGYADDLAEEFNATNGEETQQDG